MCELLFFPSICLPGFLVPKSWIKIFPFEKLSNYFTLLCTDLSFCLRIWICRSCNFNTSVLKVRFTTSRWILLIVSWRRVVAFSDLPVPGYGGQHHQGRDPAQATSPQSPTSHYHCSLVSRVFQLHTSFGRGIKVAYTLILNYNQLLCRSHIHVQLNFK